MKFPGLKRNRTGASAVDVNAAIEQPRLGRRFWLGYVLPVLVLALLVEALTAWGQLEGRWLRAVALAVIVAWPLLVAVCALSGRRVWRAATLHLRRGGLPLHAYGAQAVVAATSVWLFMALLAAALPQAGDWFSLLAGKDPLGRASLQPAADGRRARLSGFVGLGDAARIDAALATAPGVHLLELDIGGARFAEARALAAGVQRRGLHTRIVGDCNGACALVFLAGQGRQVMPSRGLGLHRLEVDAAGPLTRWSARRWSGAEYRAMGMPASFVFNAVGSPPAKPWLADGDELFAAGLAGVPGRPLDVTLPPRAGAQPAEVLEALQSSPAWRVLDQRKPGLIVDAAQRMFDAQAAGADDEAVQVAAQRVVEPLLRTLLQESGYTLHEPYAALLAEQLEAARSAGPAACQALLGGDTAARRALPAPLVARETAWLLEAAREKPAAARRKLNPLEMEVMRRSLGNRAPALLSTLRSGGGGEARADACDRPIALIAEISRLPPGERRLATRLMFERP